MGRHLASKAVSSPLKKQVETRAALISERVQHTFREISRHATPTGTVPGAWTSVQRYHWINFQVELAVLADIVSICRRGLKRVASRTKTHKSSSRAVFARIADQRQVLRMRNVTIDYIAAVTPQFDPGSETVRTRKCDHATSHKISEIQHQQRVG